MQLDQLGCRLEPDLFREATSCGLEEGERLRLPARAVEREELLRPEALPQWIPRHEHLELRGQLAVAPTIEIRIDARRQTGDMELLESGPKMLEDSSYQLSGARVPQKDRQRTSLTDQRSGLRSGSPV